MRQMLTVGAVLAAVSMGAWGQAPGSDVWDNLGAANNLDVKGNPAFHLEIAFQIYGMNGKATRNGTVEDGWGAPGVERIVVHLAGVNEDGSLPAGASHELVRDRYLVNELLNSAVHPVPETPAGSEKIKNEKKRFGKVDLDCIGPEMRDGSGQTVQRESVCTQPQNELVLVRLSYAESEVFARESTGRFHDADVALKLRVAYMGRNAITGEVTRLQSFDADKPEVALRTLAIEDEAMPNGPMHTENRKGVVLGKTTETVHPTLPNGDHEAKATVNVVIGKDGSVVDVAPIACSDAAFCNVVEKSLLQWKYSPSLLNGQPTEVGTTTTISVWRN